MTELNEELINRVVEDLLRGHRIRPGAAGAEDRAAIMAAAALAGSREGHPRMSPELRRRLTALVTGTPEPGLLDRRAALAAVAGLAVGAAGAFGLGRLAGSSAPAPAAAAKSGPPAGILRPSTAFRWIAVGLLSEFPDGEATQVVAGSVSAYLFRKGDAFRGISSMCSHLPCALDWRAGEKLLFCPCHQQTFSPEGLPTVSSYEVPPLPSVRVKVEAGQVFVLAR